MRKKVLGRVMGALLSASMLIVMLPIHNQVKAAPTEYGVWIASKQITSENCTDVNGDGKISYNPSSKTLTLDNATISNLGSASTSGESACILTTHDLTIKGSGNLSYSSSGGAYGIYVKSGDLTLSCDLEINMAPGANYAGDGIHSSGKVTMNGGTIHSSCRGNSTGTGIRAGSFIMNAGNLKAFGSLNGLSADSVSIKGGTASFNGAGYQSMKGKGINAKTVDISNGNVTIYGRDYGIYAETSISVTGGYVEASVDTSPSSFYGEIAIMVRDSGSGIITIGSQMWIRDGYLSDDQKVVITKTSSGTTKKKAIIEKAPDSHSVTVNNDGHGTGSANKSSGFVGEEITLSATPNPGYHFKQWQVVSGGVTITNNKFTIGSSDVVIKAVFEADVRNITINNDGNGTASANKSTGIIGDVITLTANPKPGYKLKQWQVISGGVTVTNNKFTIGTSDVVIKAIFEMATYTVTVNNDGNGTGSANKASGNYGEEVTLSATPNPGYHFKQWQVVSGGVTITNNKFTIGSSDVVIKAIFEADTYSITVNNDGNGTGSANKSTGIIGDVITLTANPKPGYHFKQWQVVSGGVTVTNNKFTIGTSDVVIKAIFEQTSYTITVNDDGNGTGDASLSSGYIGDTITLTANPKPGFKLKEWQVVSGGVTVTNDTFTIGSSDVVIKAVFEAIPYSVTVTSGTADKTTATVNETVTITASVPEGKKFVKWNVVSGLIYLTDENASITTFTMETSDVEIEAVLDDLPTHAVTVTDDGHGTATASADSGWTGRTITLDANPEPGYQFKEWIIVSGDASITDPSLETTSLVIGTNDTEVQAAFEVDPSITFNVTVNSGSADMTVSVTGATVTLTADAAPTGKEFDKWVIDAGTFTLDDETSTTTTFTMPNEDVEVTATYKDITYTVTFETNGGSAVASQTVVYGNKAAKPADPTKDGFKFDGWYQDPSFAADFNFDTAITADTTVYAKWVEAPKSSEVTYTVVQGADGSWTPGSGEDYVVIVKRSEDDEHCIDYFKGARIDDKELVAGTDYTAVSGSTVLTIKAATLEALGAGSHTITVVFNDAEISTKLTFTAKDDTTTSASTAQTNTAATTPAMPTPASTVAAVTSAPSKAAGSKVVKTGEKASATSKIAQVFVGLSVIALGVLFIERRKRKNEE